MFLSEPPATRYDWRFPLFGVRVRVHPLFWLISLILGVQLEQPKLVLMWVAVVFVSILVHEFGHVLAFRYYGLRSRVVLHALGGLAIADVGYADSFGWSPRRAGLRGDMPEGWSQIVISLAGPAAGFVFAAAIVVVLLATGTNSPTLYVWGIGERVFIQSENLFWLVDMALQINILWGLINLLPIYPLDGGHISRELFVMASPRRGIVNSLKLSIAAAVLLAIAGIIWGGKDTGWYTVLFSLSLAFSSYQILQAYQGQRGYGDDRSW